MMKFTGLDVTQSTINLLRVFGVLSLGFVVISWLMRNAPASEARSAYLLGVGIMYVVFIFVDGMNTYAVFGLVPNIGGFIF